MKKITDDVLGRSMNIALVAKPAANAVFGAGAEWTRPVYYEVKNSSDIFVRMPLGQYAVRVMSQHAVDLLIHVDGQLRRRVSLPKGVSFVETDGDGQILHFMNPGDVAPLTPRTDAEAIAALTAPASEAGASDGVQPSLDLDLSIGSDVEAQSYEQAPLKAPSGHGVVFIVARFAEESGPGFKPPAQEYEMTFVMKSPADHDDHLASHGLLHMTAPESLINPDDELSFEPSQSHRPTFVCTCTGCRSGGSLRNY